MQPLNPFLRAFFSSKLPAQCQSPSNYVLFIPTTEHLLTHKEHETQTEWEELVASEEIIASHVVRIPAGTGLAVSGKDGPSLRDGRGKAKQFPTMSGKTVVVKDNFIYSNKGFKSLNQAQLLQDVVYYPDVPHAQQWLIYYISKPLVGSPEPLCYSMASPARSQQYSRGKEEAETAKRPEIKSFADLLNNFPVIAQQIQPGLEKLFQQFIHDLESPPAKLDDPTSPSSSSHNRRQHRQSIGSITSLTTLDGALSLQSNVREAKPQETHLRNALEKLVFAAIDLFQDTDKHQLSILGSSTDLSGHVIESMIEQYVTEHFHGRIIFPVLCKSRQENDEHLSSCIKYMTDLDIIQVGAELGHDNEKRRELSLRLTKGVDTFKKMGVGTSPQEMLSTLVESEKCITSDSGKSLNGTSSTQNTADSAILTNADLLVSMLLLVVIRSGIRNLHARLVYMLEYRFLDHGDSGEVDYVLSTFEAVLSYLANKASGLRRASQANRSLWRSVRKGDVQTVKQILEADEAVLSSEDDVDSQTSPNRRSVSFSDEPEVAVFDGPSKDQKANGHAQSPLQDLTPKYGDIANGLAHVFPWHTPDDVSADIPKPKKRVSIDLRSMSSSSEYSGFSQVSTARSSASMKVETSVDRLCKTRDATGSSVLMMAVDKAQNTVLQYLCSRSDLFSVDDILGDCNDNGTTLLQAALQGANQEVVLTLVDVLSAIARDDTTCRAYLSRQDSMGRSAAHYLFNCPQLISSLGPAISWQLQDKNGQTPLFALCRSYDHDGYHAMVETAIEAATRCQADGERLHLDMHTDHKTNTLLHVANHPKIIRKLLWQCDSDPNLKNDKHFTPLMIASKFARLDTIRILFNDERTDIHAREQRGLSAVELAKDDEVRNRIDDLLLLRTGPSSDGRMTNIVRSFFVEDGSIRMILKSGAPNENSTVTVTTCRRSLGDFESLASWLALEHPASFIPSLVQPVFRSPFQVTPRPSRAVLLDTQVRLNTFLQSLLTHPTFATHEMLWEFFLVPDISPAMLAQRAQLKATLRVENLRQEYSPVRLDAVSSVELFVAHASEQLRAVHDATAEVLRLVNVVSNISTDLSHAQTLVVVQLAPLTFLPADYHKGMASHEAALAQPTSLFASPLIMFQHHLLSSLSCAKALLTALERPGHLFATLRVTAEQLVKHEAAAARSARWPSALGLLDDARKRSVIDSAGKAEKARVEMENIGRELAYTNATVVGELAGWWERRGGGQNVGDLQNRGQTEGDGSLPKTGRQQGTARVALRELAQGMLVREKERLERFRRAGRAIGVGMHKGKTNV